MTTEATGKPLEAAKAGSVRVLITAAEAYPALERAFLEAREEILAGFRVFDLRTRLRSDAAREVGDSWFDLIIHTLKRGVRITMVLSDFDPVMAPDLHRATWLSKRQFIAAAECSGRADGLRVVATAHPARVGRPQRLLFWPWVWRRLRDAADELNALPPVQRARRLENSPGLQQHLRQAEDGTLLPRRWPPADLFPATHHQKIAVFDRRLLYIGGLDLDERRYDERNHARRRDETWHDVQLMVQDDPAVAEAQTHLERFLDVTNGDCAPPETERLLLTLSRRRRLTTPFLGPRPLRRDLARAHERRIREARESLYLETQFFRDPGLSKALARAGRENPQLQLVMVLPGAPEDVAFEHKRTMDARYGEYLQTKTIDRVQSAFGDRALFCAPVRPVPIEGGGRDTLSGSPIIYVHAKMSIFDGSAAIVSSANLNSRSLHWDTEAGLELTDPEAVRHLHRRALDHWLKGATTGDMMSGNRITASLRAVVQANHEAHPKERQGFLVPFNPIPARRFGRPAPGIPPEMV